jgi:hypothetical protein
VPVIDATDPRWSLLCAGMLTPEDAEQLHLEAEASPVGLELWRTFVPSPKETSDLLNRKLFGAGLARGGA